MPSRAIIIDVINAGLSPNKPHKHLTRDGHLTTPPSTVKNHQQIDVVETVEIVEVVEPTTIIDTGVVNNEQIEKQPEVVQQIENAVEQVVDNKKKKQDKKKGSE